MSVNIFDRLLDACADPNSYPAKLIRSELFPYALRRYNESIVERESRVFSGDSDSEYWRIRFYDLEDQQGMQSISQLWLSTRSNSSKAFPSSPHFCDSIEQLHDYLLEAGRKDPRSRHL